MATHTQYSEFGRIPYSWDVGPLCKIALSLQSWEGGISEFKLDGVECRL